MGYRVIIVIHRRPGAVDNIEPSPRPSGTVSLVGELDLATAPRARRLLREALELGQGTVTVDLSALEFIDAAGMRVLVDIHGLAQQKGRSIVLMGAGPRIQRLLSIMGLDEIIASSVIEPGLFLTPSALSDEPHNGDSMEGMARLGGDGLRWTRAG